MTSLSSLAAVIILTSISPCRSSDFSHWSQSRYHTNLYFSPATAGASPSSIAADVTKTSISLCSSYGISLLSCRDVILTSISHCHNSDFPHVQILF